MHRLNVLLLDDDPSDLMLVQGQLRRLPELEVTVHAFSDPAVALECVGSGLIDLVLTDRALGATTGMDFFVEAQLEGYCGPVILLTDQGSEELVVEAMHAGFADGLAKGNANPESLKRSIGNAVDRVTLQRELAANRERLHHTVIDLQSKAAEIEALYHTLSHELKTPTDRSARLCRDRARRVAGARAA